MAGQFTSRASAPGASPEAAGSVLAVSAASSASGRFTSRMPGVGATQFGTSAPNIEDVVRPFESFKERRDQRLEQIRNPPGQEVETATLCWGKAPPLQQSATNPLESGERFTTRNADEEPPDPEDDNEFVFTEVERKTKKIRVENPDDKDQYVMVERIEVWYASGSDGRRFRFVFKNK